MENKQLTGVEYLEDFVTQYKALVNAGYKMFRVDSHIEGIRSYMFRNPETTDVKEVALWEDRF